MAKNRDANDSALGVLNQDYIEGSLKDVEQQQHSSAKELVEPGKDAKNMMMRTHIKSREEAMALSLAMNKMDEFNDKEGKDLLLYWMSLQVSINGEGRDQYLQATTGQLRFDRPAYIKQTQKEKEKFQRDISADD